MKCPYYDEWDYSCKVGGDLCHGEENHPGGCEVYIDEKEGEV
jgi:hypothetical protein